jgi:hypothetical protein
MDVRRLMRGLGPLVCVVALATLTPASSAQTNNDLFANAFWLGTGDLDATVNNTSYDIESNENLLCTKFDDRGAGFTAWWVYVGSGRPVTVTTQGSSFDTIVGVYTQDDTLANQVACDDGNLNETITFPSLLDETYYVQVGGCIELQKGACGTPILGTIHLLATTPAPANDNRATAQQLPTGSATQGDNVGSTEEPGETLSCSSPSMSYGRTTWYVWHAPGTGTATFTASGGADPVLAVYNGTSQLGCDHPAQSGGTSRVQLPVAAGDYFVQLAGAGAHSPGMLSDSDQGSTTVKADFAPAPAPSPAPVPSPPASHSAPALQAVTASLGLTSYVVHTSRRYTVLRLIASNVAAGTRIQVTCRGHGCPFASRAITARRASPRLALGGRAMRRARLRKGAVVEVRISKPGLLGRVTTYRIRAGRLPAQSSHCTLPGSLKTTPCPA